MKNKHNFLILGFFVLVLLMGFVSAKELISSEGVIYDSDLLKAFENRNYARGLMLQPDFIGLEIIGDEVWGRIIINIKDNSGIEYSGTKEERLEQSKQKDKWFAPVTQKVLDDITKTEIKDINKGVNGFSALVTKKGFEELINDGRIDKVIWSQYGPRPFKDNQVLSSALLIIFSLFFVLLIIILLLFRRKRRKIKR